MRARHAVPLRRPPLTTACLSRQRGVTYDGFMPWRRAGVAVEDIGRRRWIEPNPHEPDPAEAWVLPRCVSAWGVIGQLKLDYWKTDLVAMEYELPLEAVEEAVGYYREQQDAIDARIAENR